MYRREQIPGEQHLRVEEILLLSSLGKGLCVQVDANWLCLFMPKYMPANKLP